MLSYRHNPYVGSFHSTRRLDLVNQSPVNVIESKSPLLPMFRHAPARNSPLTLGLGLKEILYDEKTARKPFVTQVQVSNQLRTQKHVFPDALKHLPLSIFDISLPIFKTETDDIPLCSICLESFKDGDELRTLECSHCFHRRCIDLWLVGCLSDEHTNTRNCPQCRQTIEPMQPSAVVSSDVFLRIGQSLLAESLSDVSSDDTGIDSGYEASGVINDIAFEEVMSSPEALDSLCGSIYDDCGFPL